MSEHALPVARLVGTYVNKVVKATGVCFFECLFLRQSDEWKTHYTNLSDRLTLVTSLTRLLDWLSNFQQGNTPSEHTLESSRNLQLKSGSSSDVQMRHHLRQT